MPLGWPDKQGGRETVGCRRLGVLHWLAVFLVTVVCMQVFALRAEAPPRDQKEEATSKRLKEKPWWPTAGSAKREAFAGNEACGGCHSDKVFEQQGTSMAKAAWKASDTAVLVANPSISLSTPPFETAITKDRKGSTYTVKRGGEAMTGRIVWSMGNDTMGQTFVVSSEGNLFEGELSYFASIQGLDLTPGHTKAAPQDLERAFGELQSPDDAKRCFGCHTTESSVGGHFDPERAIPGITCEGCHGPGALHVKAMQDNKTDEGRAAILNPASFDAVKLNDYCGACHRTSLDVAEMKAFVPLDIRFQPYRLSKSKCWSKPDRRLTCIACHNPHSEVSRDVTFYDSKCLACHASKPGATAIVSHGSTETGSMPACKVGTSRCVSCHMPKYKVQQMHGSFTDHDIRIVRAGDAFPL